MLHKPSAVVLDTNAIVEMGLAFQKPWFSQLKERCAESGIEVWTTVHVVDEWVRRLIAAANKDRNSLLSSAENLRRCVVLPEIKLPAVSPEEVLLRATRALAKHGVSVISCHAKTSQEYIHEAIQKVPPFEDGGKGLVDAVILDTVVTKALQRGFPALMVISNDGAVLKCGSRFVASKIAVTFFRTSEAVAEVERCVSQERLAKIARRDESVVNHVRKRQAEIFEWMMKNQIRLPIDEIGSKARDSSLLLSAFSPTHIVDMKPTNIKSVSVYTADEMGAKYARRYPVDVEVDCVCTVKGSERGLLDFDKEVLRQMGKNSTAVSIADFQEGKAVDLTPTPQQNLLGSLGKLLRWSDRRVQVSVQVPGSIDAAAFDAGVGDGFSVGSVERDQTVAVLAD